MDPSTGDVKVLGLEETGVLIPHPDMTAEASEFPTCSQNLTDKKFSKLTTVFPIVAVSSRENEK